MTIRRKVIPLWSFWHDASRGCESRIDIVAVPQVPRRSYAREPCSIRSNRASMPAMAFLHRRELIGTGRPLICRLPGLVRHAVDGLAALVLGHRSAFGVRLVLEPVRQAIAAEAREVHQVDVLDIGAAAQMFDEAPEHRGFKFRSGFVVDCHDCYLAAVRRILILSGSSLTHLKQHTGKVIALGLWCAAA